MPDVAPELARVDVAVLAVPDDQIAAACAGLAEDGAFQRVGDLYVAHLSGSLGLEVLEPAEREGADVLSLHPLQSVPDVETGIDRLPGSTFAVTARFGPGYRMGERLARDVGGRPFRLPQEVKSLYHSAAVFASNYLVVVEALAERLFRRAGLEDPLPMFEPLARGSLEATFSRGPERALTGPAARGEAGTVARNIEALSEHAPEAVRAYVELARLAVAIAEEGGRLSRADRGGVERELDRWT
jgi:predicted short-subunit dehydrogenase-like oxidoreductase (DUF2520 family)